MIFTIGFLVDSVPMTSEVISGTASLGGSESACLGLARALKARGHDVRIFTSKLDPACEGPDQAGVVWHPLDALVDMNRVIEFDVFVVLRSFPHLGAYQPQARLVLQWHQDLLTQPKHLMSVAWAIDHHVYVSDYQRQQYEDLLPEIVGQGYVTKNGFDPSLVPADVVKDPNRIIHITRPERGLKPLLQMWPHLKAQRPHATLGLCRYQSMYDGEGSNVKASCEMFDRVVARVNDEIGGIEWLGHLGKADLYREIATSAVMWYPGIASFAETSCIAAIESQANGTPFVGSVKGALPETVPYGVLVSGDAETREYQEQSVDAVVRLLDGCRDTSFAYRKCQQAGRAHVTGYTYAAIAAEWDAWIEQTFRARYESHKPAILRQLQQYDDATAARIVASELGDDAEVARQTAIIRGEDQGPADYADRAMDPAFEAQHEAKEGGRFYAAGSYFEHATHVLDVACGNGCFAVSLAERFPHLRVTGLDYAANNIVAAKAFATAKGVADRCTFYHATVWDLAEGVPAVMPDDVATELAGQSFDGAFVGEFLEHVADAAGLVDHVDTFLVPGARVVYTMPSGPFYELRDRHMVVKRGHVHHFCGDDLAQVFGLKESFCIEYQDRGRTPRGSFIGHWIVSYAVRPGLLARDRDYAHRIVTTRPMPRLTVGLIACDAGLDIGKCLDRVWPIADEILVGDCGSTDCTADLARSFGARVIPLPKVQDHPQGFSGVRNAVLSMATGDWFLWIDTDELLQGGPWLRKYLNTAVYHGFAIQQKHLHVDVPMDHDTPVRVFRTTRGVRFFGCVHEQPALDDGNTDITPALEIGDVAVIHLGYLTEDVRRSKMLNRNLPLLKRDQDVFPQRRLGSLLVLRDYFNLGEFHRERSDGRMNDVAYTHYKACIELFASFADPADKFHGLARPFYEGALKALGRGFDLEYALGGTLGDMAPDRHAKRLRVRVQSYDEYRALVEHELGVIKTQMDPAPLKTDPFPAREPVAA